MPSKGVQCYTYIAVPGCSIELSVPNQTVVRNELRVFRNEDLEVESKNIPSHFDKSGKFSFKVLHNGILITEQCIHVNALTGDASDGTMDTIANTPSVLHGSDIIVTYGFYEAGHGDMGLPDRHQCYVTVTPNYGNWMGTIAPAGSAAEEKRLTSLVVPAAHDVGMNSMQNCSAVLKYTGGAVVTKLINDNKIASQIADKISGPAISLIAPNIVASLAITQKDTLETILQIGARYFEFRPAHCHKLLLPVLPFPDKLYFQHGAVPGMSYEQFLNDTVQFLVAHPTEIVIVQLRWDGVPGDCAQPNDDELRSYLDEALKLANGSIVAGNLDDLRKVTIGQLRRDRKRLIMIKNADSFSTYTDAGNATLNGDSILTEFVGTLQTQNFAGKDFITIQCQATASNIPDAVMYSVLSASATTSCLLATKALCDSKTLPWVRENVLKTCGNEMVVVMNDFFDGATADVAVELSRQRLG